MAAEIVPDSWDSYKNAGLRFACDCTVREVGNPEDHIDRPHYWELDTDHEVAVTSRDSATIVGEWIVDGVSATATRAQIRDPGGGWLTGPYSDQEGEYVLVRLPRGYGDE